LEDAAETYEESMFKMSVSPKAAPETSTMIDIEFVEGIPVKLTNKTDGTVKVSQSGVMRMYHVFILKHFVVCLIGVQNLGEHISCHV